MEGGGSIPELPEIFDSNPLQLEGLVPSPQRVSNLLHPWPVRNY